MAQSIVQLPESAEIVICGWMIKIKNREVQSYYGLLFEIMQISRQMDLEKEYLSEFEGCGVSFEAVIEECIRELEEYPEALTGILYEHYGIIKICDVTEKDLLDLLYEFSKSNTGRTLAEKFAAKIRSCENWKKLNNTVHEHGKFQKELKKTAIEEIDLWYASRW